MPWLDVKVPNALSNNFEITWVESRDLPLIGVAACSSSNLLDLRRRYNKVFGLRKRLRKRTENYSVNRQIYSHSNCIRSNKILDVIPLLIEIVRLLYLRFWGQISIDHRTMVSL